MVHVQSGPIRKASVATGDIDACPRRPANTDKIAVASTILLFLLLRFFKRHSQRLVPGSVAANRMPGGI